MELVSIITTRRALNQAQIMGGGGPLLTAWLVVLTAAAIADNESEARAAAHCVPAAPGGACHTPICCAVCTATADCTAELQAALDSPAAHTIVFAARTWVTTPLHLTRNNTKLLFAPGALVLAKKGAFHDINANLFAAYVTTNLTISGYGATWRMRRSDYNDSAVYSHSEGRHGLNLMGCFNTVVEGLRIELTGGDSHGGGAVILLNLPPASDGIKLDVRSKQRVQSTECI